MLTVFTDAAAELRVRHRYTIGIAIIVVLGLMLNYKLSVSTDMADAMRDISIPLGLSYYCFRSITYLIERGRNARSRTSGAYLFVVLLVIAPPSQELEPPTNPERFKQASFRYLNF